MNIERIVGLVFSISALLILLFVVLTPQVDYQQDFKIADAAPEIEEIAKSNDKYIFKEFINFGDFPTEKQINRLSKKLMIPSQAHHDFNKFVLNLFKLFFDKDLSLVEINPLIVTKDHKIVALDCKISLDDNALFKHENLEQSFDWLQVDEKEAEAHKRSEVAKRNAQVEIEKAQYEFEGQRLRAEEIAREEISKQQIEIAAEAEAERQRRIARGHADATLAAYNAEAEGQRAVLEAKAEGYAKLVKSAGGDAKAAATLLMVEKIEELVARQTEAIANLKIDKITVWDSGNNSEGGGSTSNFVSSLMQSLPPVHDVAKMAGVELPEYLGAMKDE